MSNHDYLAPILDATDTDAINAGIDASPPVADARAGLATLEQEAHAWQEKLATCQTALERAREHRHNLGVQREPLLVAARIDAEPAAIAQLAPLTAALTAALVEEDDAASTLRLVQDTATARERDRADAERRLRVARRDALEALAAEQAATADAQLDAAADAAARWVALATLSGTLASQLGVPYERHTRNRVEAAVAFAFQRIYHAGRGAPLAGHVHATPAANAREWEQARQAAEPAAPVEEPAAASDGWRRHA
jgi:hypothetical protein